MMAVMSDVNISELRVRELLGRIGSDHVTPGAGAAGAVALGLAAACAHKAVSISARHRPEDGQLGRAAERFAEFSRRALIDADRDSVAFAGFIRSPGAAAAQALVREGEKVGHLIEELLDAIGAIEPLIEKNMAGDLLAARSLAGAARDIQRSNEAETKSAEAK